MKKNLVVATVLRHIVLFHLPYLEWLKNNNCEVHIAEKLDVRVNAIDTKYYDKLHSVPFSKKPIHISNLIIF